MAILHIADTRSLTVLSDNTDKRRMGAAAAHIHSLSLVGNPVVVPIGLNVECNLRSLPKDEHVVRAYRQFMQRMVPSLHLLDGVAIEHCSSSGHSHSGDNSPSRAHRPLCLCSVSGLSDK